MDVKRFEFPVRFLVGIGKVRHVVSTEEALYLLQNLWPYLEGQPHENAVQVCREVLAGKGTDGEAREAFIGAEVRFEMVE